MSPNPLLDDLVAAETEHLIAVGNLKRKREPDLPAWTLAPWQFTGYRARIRCVTCTTCGEKTEITESISVCEHKDTETRPTRETSLDLSKPLALIPNAPRELVFSESRVSACPTCALALGFC